MLLGRRHPPASAGEIVQLLGDLSCAGDIIRLGLAILRHQVVDIDVFDCPLANVTMLLGGLVGI